ncbi:MAG: FKBP-type peptidyl-prolyl cis-trans isomerase [Gemmatimonadetes bacterium]|nr:FKBP-type peptidyl-prolyl cis-trans isomerase [Gemmatimonadota bacterium]
MKARFFALAVLAVLPACLDATDSTNVNGCGAPKVTISALNGDTVRTASGLKYLVRTPGTGATALSNSLVTVAYAGYLTDGTLFDSNPSATFAVNQLIPGFAEGVTGMKVGESRRLIIPSVLGYGTTGAGNCIPPNATLIFDVDLRAAAGL